MKHVISFEHKVWNALCEIASNEEWPYLHISRNKVIATDGEKIAVVRTLKKDVTGKGRHVFIPKKLMPILVDRPVRGKLPVIKIMITDNKVLLKYPNDQVREVEGAFYYVNDFPTIRSLKIREEDQTDTRISFHIKRSVLKKLLDASTADELDITVHEDTIVGKWKAIDELGFFAQLQPE